MYDIRKNIVIFSIFLSSSFLIFSVVNTLSFHNL